jgi:16S rRNA (cytosine1402-N4)-methyltransferase
MEGGHLPVMVEEIIVGLSLRPGSLSVDATVGGGGHAARILEATSPDGRLLGIDADRAAIERAGRRLAPFGERVRLRQANFEELAAVAAAEGIDVADALLFDLGLSSDQLADESRGFSFRAPGRLDMRFDTSRGRPAAELLATSDEGELIALLRRYGEEPYAGRIARAIVRERARQPIESATELAALVEGAVPAARSRRRTHPATRVFQALRIAVNRELEVLPPALGAALELLRPGGRLAVLAYHSLEDRIVKRFVATERRGCICPPEIPVCVCGRSPRLRPIGPTPMVPSAQEIGANPRARSARLRIAERLAA